MEDTTNMGCGQCSGQNTRGVEQKPKTSQVAYDAALDVKNEDIPCAVDVRVTKQHGGVRFTLSKLKKIRKSERDVKFVQSPSLSHLTKDQPTILTAIDTLLQSALSKTRTEETKPKDTSNKKRRHTNLPDRALPLKKRRRTRQTKKTNKNKTCVSQQKTQDVKEGVESLTETHSLPTYSIIPTVRTSV